MPTLIISMLIVEILMVSEKEWEARGKKTSVRFLLYGGMEGTKLQAIMGKTSKVGTAAGSSKKKGLLSKSFRAMLQVV